MIFVVVALAIVLGVSLIASNISYFSIKQKLKKNGYKVNYLFLSFEDLFNMADLIEKTEDLDLKTSVKRLSRTFYLSTSLFVISIILILIIRN